MRSRGVVLLLSFLPIIGDARINECKKHDAFSSLAKSWNGSKISTGDRTVELMRVVKTLLSIEFSRETFCLMKVPSPCLLASLPLWKVLLGCLGRIDAIIIIITGICLLFSYMSFSLRCVCKVQCRGT